MRMTGTGLTSGALMLIAASQAWADETPALSTEFETELGFESVFDSDDPDEEYRDAYVSVEASLEYALGETVTAFLGASFESVTDAEGSRAFRDLGFYVSEFGLSFDLDAATVTVGKFDPSFGVANDAAPSFFGADLADEYAFEEALGIGLEVALGRGTLNAAAFYLDDTALSDSWGTRRGRIRIEDGGPGNTGKLDNFALQYDLELDRSSFHAGLRHLSKGRDDDADERAVALGVTHALADGLGLMAEVGYFSGFEGSAQDARLGILGLSYEAGPATYSASVGLRDIEDERVDRLHAVGLDIEITDNAELTAGYAFVEEEGVRSHTLGLAVVFRLGD